MEKFVEETHGERYGEAKVGGLRAELLNCPHTLLQLPCIRKRLYQMSFTYPSQLYGITQKLHRLLEQSGRIGEEIFRRYDEVLNIAKSHSTARWKLLQRCVKDTTYYYLVGLEILLAKLCKSSRWDDLWRRVVMGFLGNSDTLMCMYMRPFIIDVLRLSGVESDHDCVESTPYAMVAAALVVLLFCVCQFLMLFVDRGRGSRSYSSGSVDFRDVYVSIVLFRGAYIWIKFRQAATSQTSLKRKSCEAQDGGPGVYCRAVKNKWGTITHYKYEPRFKPPREKLDSGASLRIPRLSLGEYDTPGEAKIVLQIAAFYYGAMDAGGWVALEDGSSFVIPAMDEHEKRLSGLSKAEWVTDRAKKVFKELHPETRVKSRKQCRTLNAAVGVNAADPVGSGPHGPIPAPGLWGVQHSVPEMENDAPQPYHHGNSSGHDREAIGLASDQQMIAELARVCCGLASPADNCAAQEFVAIPQSSCPQGWEIVGAVHDNRTVNFCELVQGGDHEPLASGLKELLQEYAVRVADLEYEQRKAGSTISELRQDNEQLRGGKLQDDVMISELQRDNVQLRAGKLQADVMISELRRDNEQLRAAKAQEAAEIDAYFVIDFPWENGR